MCFLVYVGFPITCYNPCYWKVSSSVWLLRKSIMFLSPNAPRNRRTEKRCIWFVQTAPWLLWKIWRKATRWTGVKPLFIFQIGFCRRHRRGSPATMATGWNESDWLTTIRWLEWQQKGQVIRAHLPAKNRTHIIKTHPAQKAKQTFLPLNYPGWSGWHWPRRGLNDRVMEWTCSRAVNSRPHAL